MAIVALVLFAAWLMLGGAPIAGAQGSPTLTPHPATKTPMPLATDEFLPMLANNAALIRDVVWTPTAIMSSTAFP
jgi:hypothetical protein